MKTDHLLIIRFSAIGDVAMTVPVVYSLARQYPSLHITVLSKPFSRTFFEGLSPNISFMSADVKNEYQGLKGLNALYRRLTAKRFTAVADFHDVLRSRYLRLRFWLAGTKTRHIDKHRRERQQLISRKHKVLRQLPTSFQNYADVLARLGYPVKLDFHSIFPDGQVSLSSLPQIFTDSTHQRPWIGLAPFAAHKGKIYPLRLMEQTLAMLIERYPHCRMMLFGGGDKEKAVFNTWCRRFQQVINASETLQGMTQELMLMSQLDLMISMDSANMHLASLVGTPVVSIWGATHPYAGFMGWQQQETHAVQIPLPCRPCSIYGNKPCLRGDYACLNEIQPAMIVEKVSDVLTRRALESNPPSPLA